jgi:hypothetical protein
LKKIQERKANLQTLLQELDKETLICENQDAKLAQMKEEHNEIETLLTNQIIMKEDQIDSMTDVFEVSNYF